MKALEVSKLRGSYPRQTIVERFKTHGIVILKDYLPPSSRDGLRAALERKLECATRLHSVERLAAYPRADFLLGDILAIRELNDVDYIFFRNGLLDAVRAILASEQLLYWGDSSVQFGEGGRGFHKDNVERHDASHDDWQGDYGLIRCAFYFQNHVGHSGGLKVRLGSHNIADHRHGKICDIASSYGDVVVWSMRLTHSGNNRKLRALPHLALHPRLEARAPSWLVLPEEQRRISAFCAFGRPGSHARSYIAKMNNRQADYAPYFRRARRPSEAVELLQRHGVSFAQPNDYYGELDIDGP
ncbi:MAG: hypothetical protein ABIR94_05365 [Rubrivivax sp.]